MATNVRISATSKGMGNIAKFIGYGIIAVGVIYADAMFVSLMADVFPTGVLRIAAILGAFLTSVSVIVLVIGKAHWFRPGEQMIFAWIFTGAEVAVAAMNVIVSAMVALHIPLGYFDFWRYMASATPFVSVVGWVLIILLDPALKSRHEQMEMEEDIDASEREHKRMVHAARMELKATALDQQKEYLKQHLSSATVQEALSQGSYEIARGIVSELIQRPVMPARSTSTSPALGPGKIIDADPPRNRRSVRSTNETKRGRKFTPTQAALTDTEEVEVTIPPLSPQTKTREPKTEPIKIRKNQGPYVVNRKEKKIPLND